MYNGLENLVQCKSLTHLNLSGNKIKDAEELAPLVNYKLCKLLIQTHF